MPTPFLDPADILSIFTRYTAINSETATAGESEAAGFIHSYLKAMPYFQAKADQFGLHPVKDDPLKRDLVWALVKGKGERTVVLIHHYDVVEIDDFKLLKPYAFDSEALSKILLENPDALSAEAYADLKTGKWIFGRGTADMKSGGSIQLALMEAFSTLKEFRGNLLLLAVPDEENLSAGMRSASPLMLRLKREYGLDYSLMINSEPHQRKDAERGVLSGGSIGKILPFAYVRGILAHAGKSPEGFNPIGVLSEIVSNTEMSMDLTESSKEAGEMSPPPTWLMVRDSKTSYDVSMPLTAFGCLSIQPLSNHPDQILRSLLNIAELAACKAAARVNASTDSFNEHTGRPLNTDRWKPVVYSFSKLVRLAREQHGVRFDSYYEDVLNDLNRNLRDGVLSNADATWKLVDSVLEYTGCEQPTVVIGMVPPYYPSVSHLDCHSYDQTIRSIASSLNTYSESDFGQKYELESYFTGISDLSYSSLKEEDALVIESTIAAEMPLYGEFYSIPLREIAGCAMPCINIGPWGKDFHKISERVLREDMLVRTPGMLKCALEEVFRE